MDNKKQNTSIFCLGEETVIYYNACITCQGKLDEPTRTGTLTCPNCGAQKTLSLLANKF
jgi:hypothetical protein